MKCTPSVGRVALAVLIAPFFVVVTAGCGMGDEDQVQAAVKTWEEGVLAKDLDLLMSIASENFSHDSSDFKAGSKAELREYIATSIGGGAFDGVQLGFEDMEIEIKGGTATAYPIQWVAGETRVPLELFFTKEAGGWRWANMAIGSRRQRIRMPETAADAMVQFDENSDGEIATDEMPESFRRRFNLFDANGNGGLTEDELEAAFKRMKARRRGRQ